MAFLDLAMTSPIPSSSILRSCLDLRCRHLPILWSVRPIPTPFHYRTLPLLLITRSLLTITIYHPNLRHRKLIRRVSIRRHEVHTDRISPRTDKERQRHGHRDRSRPQIRNRTQYWRDHRPATYATDYEPRAALGIFAESAHTQRDDGRETDTLEEKRDVEHGHAGIALLADGGGDEDDATCEVEEEDPAGTDEFHDRGADEAAQRKGALGAGEEFGAQGGIGAGAGLDDVVDEIACEGFSNVVLV